LSGLRFTTRPGAEALSSNTDGFDNTANGQQALADNTSGFSNTAIGVLALSSKTIGNVKHSNGLGSAPLIYRRRRKYSAWVSGTFLANTSGDNNTAIGILALLANTVEPSSTAWAEGPVKWREQQATWFDRHAQW